MNVTGWEDPNLKPTSEKILKYVRNNFVRNPYLQRMFDTRAKGMTQHIPIADFLAAKEQAQVYRRKYNNEFYFSDFFDSNQLRLLFLNFGEMFGVKNTLMNHELTSFSRNFFKGPLQGYLLNAAAYLGIYGHAGYRAGKSDEKFLTFMITTVFSSMALSPVQYLAYKNWYGYNRQIETVKDIKIDRGMPGIRKPLFARSGAIVYQRFFTFCTTSVLFSSLYGLSLYLNNCDNKLLNLAYYPSLVLSFAALNFSGAVLKHVETQTNFLNLRYFHVPKTTSINPYGLGLFLALNTLFPIQIDQLKNKDEFKHAYLEFVNDNEAFKRKERLYA